MPPSQLQKLYPDFKKFLERVRKPFYFSDPAKWIMYACVEATSFKFAAEFNKPTKSEPTLTAHLFGMIHQASSEWVRAGYSALEARGASLTVGQLELQKKAREVVTGADTALFIEISNAFGRPVTIPVLLQSKRYNKRIAKIHHETVREKETINQWRQLSRHQLPAAYLSSRIERPMCLIRCLR